MENDKINIWKKNSMGNKNKKKGTHFQYQVAKIIKEVFDSAVNIGVYQGAQCDVEGTPFWIECKVGRRPPSVFAAYKQCLEDKKKFDDDRIPVVIARRQKDTSRYGSKDQGQTLVCISFQDFISLIKDVISK